MNRPLAAASTPFQPPFPLREALKIFIPSILAIGLFIIALFLVVLPWSGKSVRNQKKEAIAIQTELAWNILHHYHQLSSAGELPLSQAQAEAVRQIRGLRFGKDGNYLFREMVRALESEETAFVPYVWQHNDDRTENLPKLSSVRLFAPWGWIVGTGLYLDEVDREISRLSKKMLLVSAAILTCIIVLNLSIIRQSFRELRRRQLAEKKNCPCIRSNSKNWWPPVPPNSPRR